MKKSLKNIARQILIRLKLPLTKNIEYDIYTEKIIRSVLTRNSNCVDVGAHKGEILDLFLASSPNGKHFAFEPIPNMYADLKAKYGNNVSVYPYALSSYEGKTEFNLVLDDPAYSGLKERQYKTSVTEIKKIEVAVRRMDDVLADFKGKIDLIKIDVEGGEFDVLKGAVNILRDQKPILIFECGKGASEFYGTKPEEIFEFLIQFGYSIFTLKNFVSGKSPMSSSSFLSYFNESLEYYFIAAYDNALI